MDLSNDDDDDDLDHTNFSDLRDTAIDNDWKRDESIPVYLTLLFL